MQVRGLCPTCRQWQDCPTWADGDGATPRCPVCHTAPTSVETHSSAARRRGVRHAEGYCPVCDRWFAGDSRFELDQPLPTCPHCCATPSRLNYETTHGWRTVSTESPNAE